MDDISSVDQLRSPVSIFEADERNLLWARFRPETGQAERPTAEDFRNDLNGCDLLDLVPKEIRTHFETGKNLYLYSWFCYRFGMVCELHTHTTMELALKTKIEQEKLPKPNGLAGMLKTAIAQKWITPEGFAEYRRRREHMLRSLKADEEMFAQIAELKLDVDYEKHEREFADRYIDSLTRAIPAIRNELGHGSQMLVQPSLALNTLFICRDLVNQLFAGRQSVTDAKNTA